MRNVRLFDKQLAPLVWTHRLGEDDGDLLLRESKRLCPNILLSINARRNRLDNAQDLGEVKCGLEL